MEGSEKTEEDRVSTPCPMCPPCKTNKTSSLGCLNSMEAINVVTSSETWLTDDVTFELAGYTMIRFDRNVQTTNKYLGM